MMVMVLDRVPAALRGELTRWLLEVKAGVFVGTVSAEVRERLWGLAVARSKGGALFLVHPARNEQRYAIRSHGESPREVVDHEGLQLIRSRERD